MPGLEDAIKGLERKGRRMTAQVRIPDDTPFFDGHFPTRSLFPGVAQLGLVLLLCERALEERLRIGSVRRLKFVRQVMPGMAMEFSADFSPDYNSVRWSLTRDNKRVSTGEFMLAKRDKRN